jgi:hypothetical protein
MTLEARSRAVFRTLVFEREDEPLPLCLCVLAPRAVAGFASFLVNGNSGIECILPMGIVFLERIVEILMASLAGFRFRISFHLRLLLLAKRRETDEGYQNCQDDNHDRQIPTPIHN